MQVLQSPRESVAEAGADLRQGETCVSVLPEPSRTLWKLPKNIFLTSGRSKVTSCKAVLGSWLK